MMRALVVVDYQNDFVDGSLGSEDARSIEDVICQRIESALTDGYKLIFTMDTHRDDYLDTMEGRLLPVRHCIRGTEGHAIYGRVAGYVPDGTVLEKDTFGCLALTDALAGCDEVELCGVATDVCVMANAVIARTACPDARIVVRRSCVASYDRDRHNAALELMPSLQIDVV